MIQISDGKFCGDKGKLGARCGYMRQEKKWNVPKADWDKQRTGMICTSAETLSSWRTALRKLCENNSMQCSFYKEEQESTDAALKRVESLAK